MEDEAKRTDLLKNDLQDLDVGTFKIKKKVKVQENLQDSIIQHGDSNFNMGLLNLKFIKVDEMNVIKVYNDIIEESSVDDKYFQTIKGIISLANKSLVRIKKTHTAGREAEVHKEEVVPPQVLQQPHGKRVPAQGEGPQEKRGGRPEGAEEHDHLEVQRGKHQGLRK